VSGYFRDEDFQEKMLMFLCRDRNFLKRTAGILKEDDFRPKGGEGSWEAFAVAQKAFEFWDKYREPIGGMLRHEMLDYVEQNKRKIGHKSREKLLDLVNNIRNADGLVAVEAIERKVIEYKQRQAMSHAIRDFITLKEAGELTPQKFYKICKEAVEEKDHSITVSNYTREKDIEKRIHRRERDKHRRYPYLFIEQLDRAIRTFPKKNYGIVLARYKTGKSTAAVFLDQVYALQGFNVLHFTLEDPKEDVEDKLDASFTGIKLKVLSDKPKKLRHRLRRQLRRLRARIKIVDGTDGGMTVTRMAEIWERFRNQGFDSQVVIIDSDEMIEPLTRYKDNETRESKEIHKDIKKWMSRDELWGWVMAQTQRGKKGARQMIVTGDDSATDISKQRRCAMCIGVGDGPEEYGEDGRYIYIATHRYDKMKIGWPIVGDFERGVFYDKEKTARAERHARHHHKED
jgi:Bacillus phage helicase DnaB-like